MEKHFATYEQSLALKDLGFDEPCLAFYWNTGKFYTCAEYSHRIESHKQNQLGDYNYDSTSAPLKSQVLQWFRDKHQLYGEVHTDCTTYPKFCYSHTKFFGNPNDLSEKEWGWENTIGQYSLLYRSYPQAESELINHLISIINK